MHVAEKLTLLLRLSLMNRMLYCSVKQNNTIIFYIFYFFLVCVGGEVSAVGRAGVLLVRLRGSDGV